ncbi:glycoside hydrolase family 3 N-terminal domain-containing protein [Deinococcus maricopensis]|uniref:Glycoside hydrolase family 3 domain protein n=1 Tax=Deinococcus maricopensis (strain DSM 21211 / LMG 22137 / NRRL B-23946 / LB-34) TaxID=709986 RepID=E8U631_DEIML|nr:glycoside hydrolase family 3 N-terminal domain-containing protein [Deinococcus maricopensis]ADV66520.1 glycoside hydrolase family 3 domain protein [Deinococcus maricopensis DSM 21211]
MLDANRTLIADLPGPDLDADSARLLRTYQFGGICLFRRNITTPERTARLIRDVRDALGEDAWIATDQEGGAVLRRLDTPQAPAPMALGATRDADAAREAGRVAARGLLDLGINWNFAPALDVNVNPLNPVIGERSFGADPHEVARLGVAWAQGLEAAGVMSGSKHYPGHGDTHTDSHLALPRVDKSRAALEAVEWVPFRAAVQAGLGSLMTAHILYPQLDPVNPATLSPALLDGVLRREWGYDGVVITDATDMRAIADLYPDGDAAPLALRAGADAVLTCGHGDATLHERNVRALQEALRSGRLPEARVQESLARLARAAARFPGTPRAYGAAEREHDARLMSGVATRAVTPFGAVPLPRAGERTLLVVAAHADVGGPYEDHLSGEALTSGLRAFLPDLQTVVYDPAQPPAAADLPDADLVLFATTARFGLTDAERALVDGLRSRRALHLALWNPYFAPDLGLPALVTYGFRDANLRALGEALRGDATPGVLPFTA